MATMENVLHRYTILASALDVLRERRLVLVSPERWPDQNDSAFLQQYQQRRNAKSVLALCLTKAAETSHHWTAFAPGSDGVRIEFYREALEQAVDACPGIICQDVEYKEIRHLSTEGTSVGKLPFLKRFPYRGEDEVRLLYTCMDRELDFFAMPLPLSCVKRITLGPNLPSGLTGAVINTIKGIQGCEHLEVFQTTLLRNKTWINAALDAAMDD